MLFSVKPQHESAIDTDDHKLPKFYLVWSEMDTYIGIQDMTGTFQWCARAICIDSLKTSLVHFFFFNFFLLFIFFISWRLITLQYCSGFCHTLAWISHGVTCIPHPDPPPTSLSTWSLWVFPVHQVRAFVSWIQPGLVICFTLDNIHVSMLFSWNIPPSPSPTESKVCSLYLCFFCCLAYRLSIFIFLNSIYVQ